MSQLALYSQFNLESPYKVADDTRTLQEELANDGIYYRQIDLQKTLPQLTLGPDQLLQIYQDFINEIKQEFNYLYADVAQLCCSDGFSIGVRGKYLSEHTHSEDEARFFIEGKALFYIHVNQKIHILQCGAGDLLIIPKSVKHWMDIGPEPCFKAIRWYNTKEGLRNNFTGSYVAESIPRWESICNGSYFKR